MVVVLVLADFIFEKLGNLKAKIISKMFWGRGSAYRTIAHLFMSMVTIIGTLTGVISLLTPVSASQSFTAEVGAQFNSDSLEQGSSIQTVLRTDKTGLKALVEIHTVTKGETVKSIAKKFNITPDTIRWANRQFVGPYSDKIFVGAKLTIPKVNGILYEVKFGDKLESLVPRLGGSVFEVREINELHAPYRVKIGQKIFIPSNNPYVWEDKPVSPLKLQRGALKNPLSHPGCKGYYFFGGFTATHNGLDLSRNGGCPIRTAAAGRVIHAGWWTTAGYTVMIDHGNGVITHYYHGDGRIWVKKGDLVSAGEEIMYMGSSGNSSGTHLHFTIMQDGVSIDPLPYTPITVRYP
jgi:LysM repeat protein